MCFFTCLDSVLRGVGKLNKHLCGQIDVDVFNFDVWLPKHMRLFENVVSGLEGLKRMCFGKLNKGFFVNFGNVSSLLH